MATIETRLADAQGLLSLVVDEWTKGEKEHAAEELEEACTRLLVLAREMRAEAPADEQELVHCCGHCGHLCNVNELKHEACPRCGTLREGVLVVARVDKWQERHEAPLVRPQGHCVKVADANGTTWRV